MNPLSEMLAAGVQLVGGEADTGTMQGERIAAGQEGAVVTSSFVRIPAVDRVLSVLGSIRGRGRGRSSEDTSTASSRPVDRSNTTSRPKVETGPMSWVRRNPGKTAGAAGLVTLLLGVFVRGRR